MALEFDPETVIAFVRAHQGYAPLVVFLMAIGETIIILSIFIPSTFLLFGVGGLLAVSGVPLLPSLIAGGLGASVGFGVMYLISALMKERLLQLWPFRRYPEMIEKAKAFSRRWGITGVVLGHFTGPIRVLVPVVAGLTHMPPLPFLAANLVGAFGWIIVFLAPGYFVVESVWFKEAFEAAKALF